MMAFRVAILDMNNGYPNQGMRCIRELLESYAEVNSVHLDYEIFDVRQKDELPDLDFDAYICTGGPGSPFEGEGMYWEDQYFDLINRLYVHNSLPGSAKKHVLFICHSFQMVCRYFEVGQIVPRKSNSFGVFPVHKTSKGMNEPLFKGLDDPFFIVDSRDWQVVQPDHQRIEEMGAKILALEKIRPHVPLERCIMAMRFTDEFFGTQFHPEADARGMTAYMMDEQKKASIIENHGEDKYYRMLSQLNDPDKIMLTQQMIIPGFLDRAFTASMVLQS
jgi:homoserine O-succinyltransferase/O-acetyltransferase